MSFDDMLEGYDDCPHCGRTQPVGFDRCIECGGRMDGTPTWLDGDPDYDVDLEEVIPEDDDYPNPEFQ